MPQIQAWQHIYSNVEKEESPRNKGGFQTLFYTRAGLTEAEISEMEGRLLYFASKVEPVKRVYFTIATGKTIVAQIVSLSEPDQFGRKGRYLAHSLIFEPQSPTHFEADPFRIFRQFTFIDTIAGALAQGDFQTGDIPPVNLDLPAQSQSDVDAARDWPTLDLKKLALLALRAEKQARRRDAITVVGTPDVIESAIETAFLFVPTALRPACSFDTYFHRCNLVATWFWAIGLPEAPVSPKFTLVDGDAQEVRGEAPIRAETAYERWALATIDAGRLAQFPRQRDDAFALAQWLDGGKPDLVRLDSLTDGLVKAVFEVNAGPVQAMTLMQVKKTLPQALAPRVADTLFNQMEPVPLYKLLRKGFLVEQLQDALYQSYDDQDFDRPSKAEVRALKTHLDAHDHPLLRLYWACWDDPNKVLPPALQAAEEADYRAFGATALRLNLLDPFDLLVKEKGGVFLDVYLTSVGLASASVDVVEVAERLVEAGETNHLPRLNGYLSEVGSKDLKRLRNLAEKEAGVPPEFASAVDEAIAALPSRRGIGGLLKSIRKRLPGRKD